MKKLLVTIFCTSLLIGCSEKETPIEEQLEEEIIIQEETEPPEETVTEEEDTTDDVAEEEEDTTEKEEVIAEQGGFLDYRPQVGSKMTYSDGYEKLFSYEIVAANNEMVQMTIYLGGTPTTHIYKWTTTELTLLYEEQHPAEPNINRLAEFEQAAGMETLLNLDGSADWLLVSDNETVTVPYGAFSNVYVIEKVTADVADADTIFRKYFAPGVGLIKETFEVTGENGYQGEAILERVE